MLEEITTLREWNMGVRKFAKRKEDSGVQMGIRNEAKV